MKSTHRGGVRRIVSFLASTVMVSAAGCASTPPSGPAHSTTSTATNSNPPLPSSRPSVTRVLDAGAYRDKPCGLFTDEQASALDIRKAGIPHLKPDSADCQRISTPMGQNDLTISYYFATDLLGTIYRRETNWPTNHSVVPLTVAGQPAVRTNLPTAEMCRLALALTETQGVEVRVDNAKTPSCDQTIQVAETIVHNLGG